MTDAIAAALGAIVGNLSLELDGIDDAFTVESIVAEEALSQCFKVILHATCTSADVELDDVASTAAVVRTPFGGGSRTWTGVCSRITCTHAASVGLSSYEIEVVPLLWLLGQRVNHRIFQGMTARSIATALLDEWEIPSTWSVDDALHPRYELRTQYAESDLDFLTRIASDEGITFCFRDEGGRSVVHFSDALHRGELSTAPLPFAEDTSTVGGRRYASAVLRTGAARPGSVVLHDLDPRRPGAAMGSTARSAPSRRTARDHRREIHRYVPGASSVHGEAGDPSTPIADSRGHIRHKGEVLGARAERDLLRERGDRRVVRFSTNVAEVRAGAIVQIDGHPRRELAGRLLVVGSRLQTNLHQPGAILARTVFTDEPYHPPRRNPRPRAFGLQSATVTGPSDGIHTDEFGRVCVRFPWDRGGGASGGGNTWVRVSHAWAGGGYGLFTLPRVGHEVLIAFVEGDPDQPVVIGSLHNGHHLPPHRLPENKTISTFRTASSPGGGGYNELRFEDRAGSEQVYLRAERDWETLVQGEHAMRVGASSTTHVRGTQSVTVGVDRHSVVTGEDRAEIGGDRSVQIRGASRDVVTGERLEVTTAASREEYGGTRTLSAREDVIEQVEGNRVLVVGRSTAERSLATHVEGEMRTTVTETIELRADKELVLRCGDSAIRISPGAIELRSPEIGLFGEDARLRLATGKLKAFGKEKAQVVSDEVVLKAKSASLGLATDAKLGGSKVKLGASSDGDDSVEDPTSELTVIELTDESGEPIPNQPFRITLASGREITGVLDGSGRAELELEEEATVSFPGMPRARKA